MRIDYEVQLAATPLARGGQDDDKDGDRHGDKDGDGGEGGSAAK